MEKRVFCQLNGNRKVIGILRGYDVRSNFLGVPGDRVAAFDVLCRVCEFGLFGSDAASGRACEIVVAGGLTWHLQVFMNIVLDEAFEEKSGGEKVSIGMVVCIDPSSLFKHLLIASSIGHSRKLGRHA